MRMEMKLRPEVVIQNLLTDILHTYRQPGKLDKMEPRDLIALMKFLFARQTGIDKNKPTEERHSSIAQMRRYALTLQNEEKLEE